MNTSHVPVCARVRLKPDALPRVREWATYMAAHREEALATLAAEGVSMESVFLESTPEADFLVYSMRAASYGEAHRVAAASTAAIETYHRAFKRETWAEVERLELLLDLQRPP